jgi:hypothetical protein
MEREMTLATRRYRFPALLAGLLCLAGAAYPAETTDPLEPLNAYIGKWTVKGQESTYLEVCAWMPGHEYVECRTEDRSGGTAQYSTSIIGYSRSDGMYVHFNLGKRILQMKGTVDHGVWRFFGDSDGVPKWRRRQVAITPNEKGARFVQQVSDGGGPWQEVLVVDYIRLDR